MQQAAQVVAVTAVSIFVGIGLWNVAETYIPAMTTTILTFFGG